MHDFMSRDREKHAFVVFQDSVTHDSIVAARQQLQDRLSLCCITMTCCKSMVAPQHSKEDLNHTEDLASNLVLDALIPHQVPGQRVHHGLTWAYMSMRIESRHCCTRMSSTHSADPSETCCKVCSIGSCSIALPACSWVDGC